MDRYDLAEAVRRSARTQLERYAVTEELLAAGAPAGAHWVADRQSGPLILRFGTEEQRAAIPAADHARRELLLHRHERARLGLGSRLDPQPGRADRGGWRLRGTKIWTSCAHHYH